MSESDTATLWSVLEFVGAIAVILILWGLLGYQKWKVWASHQSGLADLTRARNEQQIQIAQAQSRLDAADINKKAAVIEAEAVALQIEAIGKQLTAHDLYLKWQWIKMMEENGDGIATIYVRVLILSKLRLQRSWSVRRRCAHEGASFAAKVR